MEGKFGSFDFTRELTDYEIEHIDEFMAITNDDFNASEISLTEAADETIKLMEKEILGIG